mmetsp:Transcript_20187/g.25582  ORF Transcript_20187/g.25582 Transcript_20187/m.25582 type:complete len:110 (-) Transcript_20187:1737-2066(-)
MLMTLKEKLLGTQRDLVKAGTDECNELADRIGTLFDTFEQTNKQHVITAEYLMEESKNCIPSRGRLPQQFIPALIVLSLLLIMILFHENFEDKLYPIDTDLHEDVEKLI